MIALLFAAALAVAASCDLEQPTGRPGCTRAAVDALKINALQTVGTHNSYKMAIAPKEMAVVKAMAPKDAPGLDYSHIPLADQLNDGARQLELDLVYDPNGGLYAAPLGLKTAGTEPWDTAPLRALGLKVMHVPDIDYRSVCVLYTQCLREVRAWSRAHPRHVPILILLNLKEGGLKLQGAV